MAKNLDIIDVIDLESSCWKKEDGGPPEGMVSEIIEIGICELDLRSLQVISKESIIVKPVQSTISEFCTQLTTLTQEIVDQGMTLDAAFGILRKRFKTERRVIASYGDYDRIQIAREAARKGLRNPLGPTHINVKNMTALRFGYSKEFGMPKACELVGHELIGTHHRGDDDAWNIGHVLADNLRALKR